MLRRLEHRGPDAEGAFVEPGIALGQRRLSIIDLSEAANQPMFDANGRFALIQNGEIYNYRELRRELNDYNFRTESDTEVILAAYEKMVSILISCRKQRVPRASKSRSPGSAGTNYSRATTIFSTG